jgi:hypothetical protein
MARHAEFEGWKPVGGHLKYPMKKLLNKLTHYSIGKVTPELLSLLPSSDFLRERGEVLPSSYPSLKC